jgi:SAM-dependent methyltransferase
VSSIFIDQRDWDDLGVLDPLWAVWSVASFRFGRGSIDEFFESGEREIDALLAGVSEHLGRPGAQRLALDFGCGAGRLTSALARHFDEVVGVDIAPSMIEVARSARGSPSNCSFRLNDAPDLRQFATGQFDLVCSLITLQHVSRPRLIERYVAELVRVTAADGVAVFQLPMRVPWRVRAHPRRAAYHVLRRLGVRADRLYRHGLYAMALKGLPAARVERVVVAAGGVVLAQVPDERTGSEAIPSATYCVARTG